MTKKILIDREVVERAALLIQSQLGSPATVADLRAALEAAPASEQPAVPSAPASPRTVEAVHGELMEMVSEYGTNRWEAGYSCGAFSHVREREYDHEAMAARAALSTRLREVLDGAAPCIGSDPACPCQDGDACHYKDAGKSKAWPLPDGVRETSGGGSNG